MTRLASDHAAGLATYLRSALMRAVALAAAADAGVVAFCFGVGPKATSELRYFTGQSSPSSLRALICLILGPSISM